MDIWGKGFYPYHYETKNLSHEPPIPKSICEEEMQNASLDTNQVVVDYI